MATDSAPAVQVFVEPTKGEPQSEAPAPTFYCCWRCKSSNACCGPCRFACTPRRKRVCVAVVVFLCSAAVAIIIAAVYLTWPKQGRAVKITAVSGTSLSTASLSAGGSGRKLLQTPAVLTPASAVPGATECAYAQVDALSLNVAYVRFASVAGSGHDLASTNWGASQPFVLRAGANTVPLTATVDRMDPGAYFAADFVYWQRWSIQAFCKTVNKFLYTTPAGVVALPTTPSVMPPDYGPLSYDYMPGISFSVGTDTASSTSAQQHMAFINSQYSYTVDAGSTVTLSLDSTNVVACYDGTTNYSVASSRNNNGWGMVYPMGYDQSFGPQGSQQVTVPFDWTVPQFGFSSWSLPVFVQVGDGPSSAVAETYAFAAQPSLLPTPGGPAVDWSRIVVATLTWSDATSSATLLDMRARMTGSVRIGVANSFFNFTKSQTGWSMSNGQQFYYSYNMMNERIVSGFSRTADFTTQGTVAVTDGPMCGQSPGQVGMINPCSGTTATFYYVQLPRTT